MPEVEYAEQELNEMMRKYKENEVNREIFFEEEKTAKIEKQKKENDERRKKALEDAKREAGLVDSNELALSIERPVHPAEGGAPRDL
jgi:hypothetical protein